VGVDDHLANTQSQPDTKSILFSTTGLNPVEAIKDMRKMYGSNAFAFVCDLKIYAIRIEIS